MGINHPEKTATLQKFPMSNFKRKPLTVPLQNIYEAPPISPREGPPILHLPVPALIPASLPQAHPTEALHETLTQPRAKTSSAPISGDLVAFATSAGWARVLLTSHAGTKSFRKDSLYWNMLDEDSG